MNKQWVIYGLVFLAGYMLRNRIAAVPGISRLPAV